MVNIDRVVNESKWKGKSFCIITGSSHLNRTHLYTSFAGMSSHEMRWYSLEFWMQAFSVHTNKKKFPFKSYALFQHIIDNNWVHFRLHVQCESVLFLWKDSHKSWNSSYSRTFNEFPSWLYCESNIERGLQLFINPLILISF